MERVKNQGKDMPAGLCLPGDVVMRSPFIYKVRPDTIVVGRALGWRASRISSGLS
jgi:hypothetical protein